MSGGENCQSPIQGRELYNFCGHRFVESKTTAGDSVVVKTSAWESRRLVEVEAAMTKYASEQPNLLAPRFRGYYRVEKHLLAVVTDNVPGISLDKVWHTLNKAQRMSIKQQLKEQIKIFRECTQPYIGSMGNGEVSNFYERLGLGSEFMGPFESEEKFDNWCLERVRSSCSSYLWKRLLSKMRQSSSNSKRFVLTHCNLNANNIIVDVDQCKLMGITGWSQSGFFPEYVQYALAAKIWDQYEDWWKAVLMEILEPCGLLRLKFQGRVTYRGW